MTDALREAFELYFADSRRGRGAGRAPTFARMADGTYADDPTQRHWWTWQNACRPALAAPAVPAGRVLVPVEPTADMRNAFHDVTDNDTLRHGNAGAHWRAMLAAAPDAQKGEP